MTSAAARTPEASPRDDEPVDHEPGRPKLRSDCAHVPRPCPYITCRYHLWSEVSRRREELPDDSCVLDLAETGPRTLDEVGDLLGVTRERIRQIQARALRKLWRRRWLLDPELDKDED